MGLIAFKNWMDLFELFVLDTFLPICPMDLRPDLAILVAYQQFKALLSAFPIRTNFYLVLTRKSFIC